MWLRPKPPRPSLRMRRVTSSALNKFSMILRSLFTLLLLSCCAFAQDNPGWQSSEQPLPEQSVDWLSSSGHTGSGGTNPAPAPDEPPLKVVADRLLVGSADVVAERLAAEIERLQPTHISGFMAVPGIEQKRVLKSMELFGSKVMPLLAKRFGDLAAVGVPTPMVKTAA